ncbi:MAG: hypothetical protein CL908_05145 [Deltaproteobacteria bacterium]|nr:hypothetical protein [Deltaproteobacteria bacterium]
MATGEPIIPRYRDVERLASDPENIRNALAFIEAQGDEGPVVDCGRLMPTNLNGPDDRRLRGLANKAFTPRSDLHETIQERAWSSPIGIFPASRAGPRTLQGRLPSGRARASRGVP